MEHLPDAHRARTLSTDSLRSSFLAQGLFKAGEITLRHFDIDRVVLGGAVPIATALALDAPPSLSAESPVLTSSVVPRVTSRTNTSELPLVSVATRLLAVLVKAT